MASNQAPLHHLNGSHRGEPPREAAATPGDLAAVHYAASLEHTNNHAPQQWRPVAQHGAYAYTGNSSSFAEHEQQHELSEHQLSHAQPLQHQHQRPFIQSRQGSLDSVASGYMTYYAQSPMNGGYAMTAQNSEQHRQQQPQQQQQRNSSPTTPVVNSATRQAPQMSPNSVQSVDGSEGWSNSAYYAPYSQQQPQHSYQPYYPPTSPAPPLSHMVPPHMQAYAQAQGNYMGQPGSAQPWSSYYGQPSGVQQQSQQQQQRGLQYGRSGGTAGSSQGGNTSNWNRIPQQQQQSQQQQHYQQSLINRPHAQQMQMQQQQQQQYQQQQHPSSHVQQQQWRTSNPVHSYGPPRTNPSPSGPYHAQGYASRPRPDPRHNSARSRNGSVSGSIVTSVPQAGTLPSRPAPPAPPATQDSSRQATNTPNDTTLRIFRPHVHPQQGPRSEHVLWVGNVPSDATVEELWDVFSQLPPETAAEAAEALDEDSGDEAELSPLQTSEASELERARSNSADHGVLSIFIISRSNCAFVNYATRRHLRRALKYFHDRSIRPNDARCPKIVCRVRKKEDESQAGVQGQRGRGIHVAWVKEHHKKQKDAERAERVAARSMERTEVAETSEEALSSSKASAPYTASDDTEVPEGVIMSPEMADMDPATPRLPMRASPSLHGDRESTSSDTLSNGGTRPSLSGESSSGSLSLASTTSSLLRHPVFRERFFILKSLRQEDLDRSVETGLWATQPHNEAVLDQAFRNSELVYLVFSANQSGCFYGYARMTSAIRTPTVPEVRLPSQQAQDLQDAESSIRQAAQAREKQQPSAHNKPSTVLELDEEASSGSLSVASTPSSGDIMTTTSLAYLLSPGERNRDPMSSPQPMTPLDEIAEPVPDELRHPSTSVPPDAQERMLSAAWPPSESQRAEADHRAGRGVTLSPKVLVRAATLRDANAQESADIDDALASLSVSSGEQVPSLVVEEDNDGIKRYDMVDEAPIGVGSNASSALDTSTSLSEQPSLGPNDSISVSDSRRAAQVAIRAVIHNLRLEEREAQTRANRLETELSNFAHASADAASASRDSGEPSQSNGGSGSATDPSGPLSSATATHGVTTPRQASSDSWGKPFKVQWLKSTPLPFQYVKKLRNPWRDNRQIKVSRDGTELEPSVGRQLLEVWKDISPEEASAAIESLRDLAEDEDEEPILVPHRQPQRQIVGGSSSF